MKINYSEVQIIHNPIWTECVQSHTKSLKINHSHLIFPQLIYIIREKMAVTGNIIVFGPTGKVGSAVASSLAERQFGGKVYLAMRDASKSISELDERSPSKTTFERVQADLSQPAALKDAVAKTGATKAFLYALFTEKDHMRAAIEALHAGGIRFVVFLSSAAVVGDRAAIQMKDNFVGWAHGAVETSIAEVMGAGNFVALRPGWFNTNAHMFAKPILAGQDVRIPFPDARLDWTAPEDIADLAAGFLVEGVQPETWTQGEGRDYVDVVGPQLISLRDGVTTIAKAAGKEPRTVPVLDVEEGIQTLSSYGVADRVAGGLVRLLKKGAEGGSGAGRYTPEEFDAVKGRMQQYLSRPGLTLQQWAEKHKADFGAH
jgi:uncharacterized protein YbjT (DUF2867 family)